MGTLKRKFDWESYTGPLLVGKSGYRSNFRVTSAQIYLTKEEFLEGMRPTLIGTYHSCIESRERLVKSGYYDKYYNGRIPTIANMMATSYNMPKIYVNDPSGEGLWLVRGSVLKAIQGDVLKMVEEEEEKTTNEDVQ